MPTHYNGTEEERKALNAFIKLTRAVISLENRIAARGTQGDLTESQFGVLETLYHLGSLCQGTLSQKLLKSTGNMTLVIDNLEKRGLVRRVRVAEDRRMVSIELTPAGAAMIERILPGHIHGIIEEMSVLDPAEQDELGRLARKLGVGNKPEGSATEIALGSGALKSVAE
jgi:MarR family 2-MHQ and catechol resistance regulon transcriptional repressor